MHGAGAQMGARRVANFSVIEANPALPLNEELMTRVIAVAMLATIFFATPIKAQSEQQAQAVPRFVALTVAGREPICLLADEPLAGIHPRDAEVIASGLVAMARAGCAVVVTGHEVPHLMQIADEVVWVTAGTTHGLGTPAAASAHDQFRREYLGPTGMS